MEKPTENRAFGEESDGEQRVGCGALPDACSRVASALGEREQHDIMVGCFGDGRVMRPVVSQVVHDVPRPVHDGVLDLPIGVVGRGHHLDVGRALDAWVELRSVASPLEQSGTQIIRH
jgi:hypothetical protein